MKGVTCPKQVSILFTGSWMQHPRVGLEGRFAETERCLLAALRGLDQRGDEDSPLRAYALYSLRCCYMNLRHFPKALCAARESELLERNFGPDDPRLAGSVEAAAVANHHLSHSAPAVQGFERAITLYRRWA